MKNKPFPTKYDLHKQKCTQVFVSLVTVIHTSQHPCIQIGSMVTCIISQYL